MSYRSKETQKMWKIAGRYSAVGIEMCAALCFGVFGGQWLDNKFATEPIFFWIGFTVGCGAACKTIIRIAKTKL